MTIEKIDEIGKNISVRTATHDHVDHNVFGMAVTLKDKINEIIDAYTTNERNRSEQMGRFNKRVGIRESDAGHHRAMLISLKHRFEDSKDDVEEDILACPFCGSDKVLDFEWALSDKNMCKCIICNATGPLRDSSQEAINAWNKRA